LRLMSCMVLIPNRIWLQGSNSFFVKLQVCWWAFQPKATLLHELKNRVCDDSQQNGCDNIVQVANTRVPAVSAQLLVNGAFRDMTKVLGQSTA
jgi:hypothetical protein